MLQQGFHLVEWSLAKHILDIVRELYPDGVSLDCDPQLPVSNKYNKFIVLFLWYHKMNHVYGCFRKNTKAHRQVPHTVNNSFIAEVWNNTETGIIVCGLLKGFIARCKCLYFSHCLSFNTLQTNQRTAKILK